MTELRFRPAAELWPLVDRAFQSHSREIRLLVPTATVEHIGATTIPGALTKGDVDLLVRVPADVFSAASTALGARYAAAEMTARTSTYVCFSDDHGDLPVGVQLVASGSADERRIDGLRRLLRRPEVVGRTNDLKQRYEGKEEGEYMRAKRDFYSELLQGADDAFHEKPAPEHDHDAGDGGGAVPSEPDA